MITKEPFREQAQTYGTTLRIRRIADGKFQTLWQAPVEFQNLSQYSPKMQILQPPEQNIGAPGTVTTGEVTFRPAARGKSRYGRGRWSFSFSAGIAPSMPSTSRRRALGMEKNLFRCAERVAPGGTAPAT